MNSIKVLVTGAGGGGGQAIGKALRISGLPIEIHMADIRPDAVGLHRFDYGVVLPKPEQDMGAWEQYVFEAGIQAIFPGSDHDLEPFAQVRDAFWQQLQCEVMVSGVEAVRIANDKALTVKALHEAGVGVPKSVWVGGNIGDLGYGNPEVIKPRFGMTSRGVQVVHDEETSNFFWEHTENPIVQEYIEGDEFTVALTYDKTHELRSWFVLRRDLYMGSTRLAESGNFPLVDNFVVDFARKTRHLNFSHGLNIQLRVRDHQCYVLELNARCSGSTAIRARFGYNQPAMLINHHILRQPMFPPSHTQNGIVLVHQDELLLPDLTLEQLKAQTSMKGTS